MRIMNNRTIITILNVLIFLFILTNIFKILIMTVVVPVILCVMLFTIRILKQTKYYEKISYKNTKGIKIIFVLTCIIFLILMQLNRFPYYYTMLSYLVTSVLYTFYAIILYLLLKIFFFNMYINII
ncbi:Putative UPF0259 membrane protein YciC [Buchnera aphidicola (Takecallis arundicolens)]